MELSDRIKKLGKYFNEMQIVEQDGMNIIYVVVTFPYNWIIDEEFAKKKEVTIMQGEAPGQYYFSAEIDTGVDVVFDVIDANIDKMKEAIERAQLLTAKTKELKTLFENEEISIERLRSIKFTFEENILVTKNKDKNKDKEKDKDE